MSFAFSDVSTPVELDIERQIIGSLLTLVTMPARTRIASDQFAAAELRAAEETLRVAAETRRAYLRAVAARQIVAALGEAEASAEASAELAGQLKQTGAAEQARRSAPEVFATEIDAELVGARQQAVAAREKLTRLMGLWQSDLDAYLPSALPALPGSTRGVRAIEQNALNARVDVQMARAEMEAMAKSYGLTRKTHFLNVLDAAGISKTQKDRGEKRAEGGGYELVLEVPLFDFGKANVREAEQRYLEAANRLGQLGVNAASEAREAYGAYRATFAVAKKYEAEVLPLHESHLGGDRAAIQCHADRRLRAARSGAGAVARQGRGHRGQAEFLARLDRSQRGHARWRQHRFRARRGDRGDEQLNECRVDKDEAS